MSNQMFAISAEEFALNELEISAQDTQHVSGRPGVDLFKN